MAKMVSRSGNPPAQAPARPAQAAAPNRAPQAAPPNRAQQAATHQARPAPAPAPRPAPAPAAASIRPPAAARPAPAPAPRPKPAAPSAEVETDTGQELIVPDQGGELVPAFMHEDAGMGMENIGREDVDTPRLKLIQALSPELESYDELRAGQFFHATSEFSFGEQFEAVAVYMEKTYILWRPRKAGGGILARAGNDERWSPGQGSFQVRLDNGREVVWRMAKTVRESGLAQWGTMDPEDSQSPPAATAMYNYVLVFPEYPDLMPSVFTFQRSSFKKGRRFNATLKSRAFERPHGKPLFGLKFLFKSVKDRNNAGQEFYNVDVSGNGLVTDPELYAAYKNLYLSFKDVGLSDQVIERLQDDDDEFGDEEGDERGREENDAQIPF